VLKRFKAAARGSAMPRRKKMSHIRIVLSDGNQLLIPMGQKTNPDRFPSRRPPQLAVPLVREQEGLPKLLLEDQVIREKLMEKLKQASVPRIFIERASNRVRVKIYTARPGIVIGRKGQEIEKIKEELAKITGKEILLDIQEVKKPEIEAQLVAENVALQLERRIAFRRAMKKAVEMAMALGAEGIRIQCSGRLGGSDIARREWQRKAACRCTPCAKTSTTVSPKRAPCTARSASSAGSARKKPTTTKPAGTISPRLKELLPWLSLPPAPNTASPRRVPAPATPSAATRSPSANSAFSRSPAAR
jgi:small subunit ribosomal protein S3